MRKTNLFSNSVSVLILSLVLGHKVLAANSCLKLFDTKQVKASEDITYVEEDLSETLFEQSEKLDTDKNNRLRVRGLRDRVLQSKLKFLVEKKEIENVTDHGERYVVSYEIMTPETQKSEHPIILQHGFLHDSYDFHDIARILLSQGYKVILVDAANSGETLVKTKLKYGIILESPTQIDDAVALSKIIDQEGLDKFSLVGHSRGNGVVTTLAAMKKYEHRIITLQGFNPYTEWLADLGADQQIDIQSGLSFVKDSEYYLELEKRIRSNTNRVSLSALNTYIYNEAKNNAQYDPLYKQNMFTTDMLKQAYLQIQNGMMIDPKLRGYSIIPLIFGQNYTLYTDYAKKDALDPRIVNPQYAQRWSHHGITQVPESVLARTTYYVSRDDDLVKPAFVTERQIVHQATKQGGPILVKNIHGSHFSPTVIPFTVADQIIQAIEAVSSVKP